VNDNIAVLCAALSIWSSYPGVPITPSASRSIATESCLWAQGVITTATIVAHGCPELKFTLTTWFSGNWLS
jgi:hypothetical protein